MGTEASESGLRIELLGEVRALCDGCELTLGPPRQRATLAVLALRAGQQVPYDQLIDGVWGPDAPDSAIGRLHVHVSALRHALEPGRQRRAPGRVVVSTGAGYRLVLGPGQLDVWDVEAHRDRARRLLEAGRAAEAVTAFGAALRLWRGKPLAGVPGPFAEGHRVRLDELWLTVVEDQAEAMLRAGEHRALLAELLATAAEHPYRERLCALVMIALYRDGRRTEALDAFAATRRLLLDELGVEPGPHLRQIQHDILNDAGAAAGVLGAAGAAGRIVPRQLPAAVRDFTGRLAELRELDALVTAADSGQGAVIVSAIGGMAGVGKTALAVSWAHRARGGFPDGDLFVDLRGYSPNSAPMPPAEALGMFLAGLGVLPHRVPASVPEQAAMYRTLLAQRRILVVLDNARSAEQVRPLLPAADGCLVLVTSRSRLAGLVARDGAHRILLDTLQPHEAHELLVRNIGAAHAEAEPEAVRELAACCGYHPLALRVAAEHIAAQPAGSIAALAAQLRDRLRRLDLLAPQDDEANGVRGVFDWSYEALSAPQRRLFRLLGLNDGPDIAAEAAAALAGYAVDDAATGLARLAEAHLVEPVSQGRVRLHDLIQVYASERVDWESAEHERDTAVRGLTGWYLHTACAARVALSPSLPPMAPEPVPLSSAALEFDGHAAALAWFETERSNLLAATRLAERYRLYRIAWQIPTAMYGFFDLRKRYDDWVDSHQTALRCAREIGDQEAQGRIQCNLGNAYRPLRRLDDAIACYRDALEKFDHVGYRQGQAKVLGNIGTTYGEMNEPDDAVQAHESALDLFRDLGDEYGEALTRHNLGEVHLSTEAYSRAARSFAEALEIFESIEDVHGQARARAALGLATAYLGDTRAAMDLEQWSLDRFRALGDQWEEANVLDYLGTIHERLGHLEQAQTHWRQALALFDEIGDAHKLTALRTKVRPTAS